MGQKLHRNRRSTFRRRSLPAQVLPLVLSLLGVVAIVAVGFFGAKYLTEHPLGGQPAASSAPAAEEPPAESDPTEALPASAVGTDALRAFYLPAAALHRQDTLGEQLRQAADSGFNTVVFDMKDADGTLYFRSATERAAQVNRFADGAFSVSELSALFAAMRESGLRPIPRLFAFRDNAAARVLSDARISPAGNPGWVWYDNKPDQGGKAWLNPYADAAHLYVIDLARELRDAGAAAILLDGVQFPAQTSGANLPANGQSRAQALTAFLAEARQLLGDDCPVMLCCTGSSARGDNTQVYGGNPLTFGAAIAAPTVAPDAADDAPASSVQAQVHLMVTRTRVIEENPPVLAPFLLTDGFSAEQCRQIIDGCLSGGAASYIVYRADGVYDFAALKH